MQIFHKNKGVPKTFAETPFLMFFYNPRFNILNQKFYANFTIMQKLYIY